MSKVTAIAVTSEQLISTGTILDVNNNPVVGMKRASASGNGTVNHGLNGTPNFVGVQPSTATAASISASGATSTTVAVALGTTAAFNILSTIA